MQITNFNLSRNNTRITWEADNCSCEFINSKPLTYGEAYNFVHGLDNNDMQEFYTEPRKSYIELLGMVMANGRKINLIS